MSTTMYVFIWKSKIKYPLIIPSSGVMGILNYIIIRENKA